MTCLQLLLLSGLRLFDGQPAAEPAPETPTEVFTDAPHPPRHPRAVGDGTLRVLVGTHVAFLDVTQNVLVRGTLLRFDDAGIVVATDGGEVELARSDIAEVRVEPAEPANTAGRTPAPFDPLASRARTGFDLVEREPALQRSGPGGEAIPDRFSSARAQGGVLVGIGAATTLGAMLLSMRAEDYRVECDDATGACRNEANLPSEFYFGGLAAALAGGSTITAGVALLAGRHWVWRHRDRLDRSDPRRTRLIVTGTSATIAGASMLAGAIGMRLRNRAQLEAQAGFDNKTTDASARARGSHILQAIAIASLGTGVGLLTGNAVRGRWRRRASSSSLGSARGSTSIVPTGTGFAVRGQF